MKRGRRVFPSLVKLGRKVVGEIFRTSPEEEVDEEFAFHVEMRVRELLRRGHTLEQARAEAVRRFGDMEAVKAVCAQIALEREERMGRTMWFEELLQDLAFAGRQLRRNPGFALVAVLTLALGIGANTAVFSVVNGVILRPLPYQEPDRLVQVWTRYLPESGFDIPQFPISPPELLDYRESSEVMEEVGYWTRGARTLTDHGGDPVRLSTVFVDDRLFPLLGVRPALGRWITQEEDLPGGAVVLLSHDTWVSHFGSDPGMVGSTVQLNGSPREVVGVMPEGFVFPTASTQIWESFNLDEANPGNRASHWMWGVGRLKSGVTLEQARAEVESIHAGWAEEFQHNVAHFPILNRFEEDIVGADVRRILYLLLAAVGVVLAVACANVANLLLARAEARQQEVAVRAALGAGRGRVVRQFLTESLVLALAGGVLGVALSRWLTRAILAVNPGSLPRTEGIEVSGVVLGFTALATLGTAVLFGIVPALQAAGWTHASGIGSQSRSATGGRRRLRFRRLLVGAEVALSVVVLVAAGLVVRSFEVLTDVDPGARTEGILTFRVSLPASSYQGAGEVQVFYQTLLERLLALPGVRTATAGSQLPLLGVTQRQDFEIRGRAPIAQGELARNAQTMDVRPGYFQALDIPLLSGRAFSSMDGPEGPFVAVVNEELVRVYFPREDPIGQQLGYAVNPDSMVWMTVVGVVGDVHSDLQEEPLPQVYRVHGQPASMFGFAGRREMALALRTDVEPESLVPAARRVVGDLDPRLPLNNVRTMEAIFDSAVAQPRMTRNLLGGFGLIALLLSAIGIYGVVSYSVSRRTREIGIRMALGAARSQVSGLMLREGATPALIGAVLGVGLAFALNGLVRDLLFQVSSTDPTTLTAIPVLLIGVALLASYLPALRATRVAPTEALREE